MATVHAELGVGAALEVDGILLVRDGRGWLHGDPKEHGRTGGYAAKDAACIVGLGRGDAVAHFVGVVVLAAMEAGHLKAAAELDALDGGDAKRGPGEHVLDAVEHG